MSDQPTIDELHAQIAERVTTPACPFCGHDDWESPNDRILALLQARFDLAQGPVYENPPRGEAVLTFMCRRCGFLRLHFYTRP